LDGGKKKLADECPPALKELLEAKDLMPVYNKLVEAIVEEGKTRSMFGMWRDGEFVSILDLFEEDFGEKGVKVALCKRKSGSGTFRWLEFIDVDVAKDYVPQYDVGNLSGQVIKTCYTTIEFPNGVAVEKLNQHGKKRNKLKEKIPTLVEDMMLRKGLMVEYHAFIDAICQGGVGPGKGWDTEKLDQITKEHSHQFEAKGVAIFISHKQEYVSHGQYGGHYEYYRWIEFVDREEQPNYHPQRDAGSKQEKGCVVM
jgi:hypothetical protein